MKVEKPANISSILQILFPETSVLALNTTHCVIIGCALTDASAARFPHFADATQLFAGSSITHPGRPPSCHPPESIDPGDN